MNYDAVLIGNVDGRVPDISDIDALEDALPLLLTGEGQIGFSRTYATPVAGSLGEGDQQDSTLGSWVSLSQRDWVEGLLQKATSGESKRFYSAVADTRYGGRWTLPPRAYGPYELKDVSNPNNPITIGSNETVTMRWVRYDHALYCVAGGKLWRSALDENAVTVNAGAGEVMPNWKVAASDSNVITATDVDLYLQSGSYKLALANSNGLALYAPDSGVFSSLSGQVATRLRVLRLSTLATGAAHQFAIGLSPDAPADLVTGDTTLIVNGFMRVGQVNAIVCNKGIWAAAGAANQVVAFNEYETDTAGRVCAVWRGKGYIVLGDTVQAWDGSSSTLTPVGLDREAGLPTDVARVVTWLEPTADTLYAATTEDGKRSGIFAMTGDGVWHCLWLASDTSQKIYSLGIDVRAGKYGGGTRAVLNAQARLWWAIGNQTYYMYIGRPESDKSFWSDTVQARFWRGFASSGEVISSWWGGRYAKVRKQIARVTVTHEALPLGCRVNCELEVDRSGVWIPLMLDKRDDLSDTFISVAGDWAARSVATGGNTAYIDLDNVSEIDAGTFMRVGNEVLQVKTVVGNRVTFARAAQKIIVSGAEVRPARATGVEWRTRVMLTSTDQKLTPVIERVSVEFAYQHLRYARYTLYVRCEDRMELRGKTGVYGYDAEALRDKLQMWIQREPFWLLTPDGQLSLVKCINANAAQFAYQETGAAVGYSTPKNVVTLTLLEVEEGR